MTNWYSLRRISPELLTKKLVGNFNVEDAGPGLFEFLRQYAAKSIMKRKLALKS